MRENIIIVKEGDKMWFASSLDSEVVFAQGKTIQDVRGNITIVAQEMAASGQFKLSEINPSNIEYRDIVKKIYGNKKMEILLSDINVDEKWFPSATNVLAITDDSVGGL